MKTKFEKVQNSHVNLQPRISYEKNHLKLLKCKREILRESSDWFNICWRIRMQRVVRLSLLNVVTFRSSVLVKENYFISAQQDRSISAFHCIKTR